jgi:hypothetical protein
MKKQKPPQKDRILSLLKKRKRGVLNTELNEICFRYSSRLFELRAAGFPILTERVDQGVYRYVLIQ